MVLSSEKNLYEILGIPADATLGMIKSAYRKLVRKYHPDLNNGDENCARKFKEINEAYEILSDTDKKRYYDTMSGFFTRKTENQYNYKYTYKQADSTYRKTKNAHEKEKARKEESKNKTYSEPFDFSDMFNDFFRGFKNTSTKENQSTQSPINGSDITSEISISIQESISGTSRTVNVLHTQACPNCKGRKFINGAKCAICNGSGEESSHKKITVKIPAQIKNGAKIRIAGEGNRGQYGGNNGNLYLIVKIENDSIFKISGNNVLCSIPITPFEAVLGANISIPSINGKLSMKILPNTHSGQKFRLSSQGLLGENGKKGDMIVTVNIEIPHDLSDNERKLYEKLKTASSSDIRENLR
ncbi:DnaJ domain-containing protein [bacterium]|nr:DnaJ domain-containing protein [bacterium]